MLFLDIKDYKSVISVSISFINLLFENLRRNYSGIEIPDKDRKYQRYKGIDLYPAKEFFEKIKEAKERRKKEGKESKVPEKRPVIETFYADLMSSFKNTIVTNYEKEDKSIRILMNSLSGGIRQKQNLF